MTPSHRVLSLPLRWSLAVGAPVISDAGLDPTALGGWPPDHIARARGAEELRLAAVAALHDAYDIASRAALITWARTRLAARRELPHVVAAFSIATVAEYLSEDDAWQAIAVAARLAQSTYRSWDELAATCDDVPAEVHKLWAALPWDTDLGVPRPGDAAPVRFPRPVCPACGARPTRPSPTAFLYCDRCGALAGYDVASAQPLERPGPAYEAIRAELAERLAAAEGDLLRTRAVQRALFDAWVDACPGAAPVRIQDPAYRAAYVALLAEGETRAAFDAEARTLRAALEAATAQLGFVERDGATRVQVEPYRAMEAAMFAHEARRHALAVEHGIYALHPDQATPALIRQIGFSLYVQGWLPYLDDADAQALLARTGLAVDTGVTADAGLADPPATRALPCPRCGVALDVIVDAIRVVCPRCGRLVDAAGLH